MNGGRARRYFGTDGVRGRVGVGAITPERILKLGWAAGRVLCRDADNPRVVIGKDTRVSGYLLESALEAGLSAAGVDVSLTGPMPTPGVAYLTRAVRAAAGIVISASHNPYPDNGIKFFSNRGDKLPDELEARIEETMDEPLETVAPARLGKAERFEDAADRYVGFCKGTFPAGSDLRGVTLVVDAANGAAYHVAPRVFEELGARVVAIAARPDGFNINRDCGSTAPGNLVRAVVESGADAGVALDGDGDRVLMVGPRGEVYDGDRLLFAMLERRLANRGFRGGVVGTLMTNIGLERACRERGVGFHRAEVGDRHVLKALRERGWTLGGETSGHIICLDKSTTGDGIVAALEVLGAMLEGDRALDALVEDLRCYPQVLDNVRLRRDGPDAAAILGDERVAGAVSDVESALRDEGRVVMRPSGTEPLIRVMVEAPDLDRARGYTASLVDAVRKAAEAS